MEVCLLTSANQDLQDLLWGTNSICTQCSRQQNVLLEALARDWLYAYGSNLKSFLGVYTVYIIYIYIYMWKSLQDRSDLVASFPCCFQDACP